MIILAMMTVHDYGCRKNKKRWKKKRKGAYTISIPFRKRFLNTEETAQLEQHQSINHIDVKFAK